MMDVSWEAQCRWPRSAEGRGQKIVCPECGASGWIGGPWVRKHAEHVVCSCGKNVCRSGLGAHRGSMQRHGKPCP